MGTPARLPPLREVVEGRTRLLVPHGNRDPGPGSRGLGVFFHPARAFGRDLSVLYLAAVARPGLRALDGLTGGGALAARWRGEVPGDHRLTASDRDVRAFALARQNLPADVRVLRRPLSGLLAEEPFDLIDLDPFGSPVPFLDAACRALAGGGHLLVTATDTMALAGVQADLCRRRYGAWPMVGELQHELGVRILVGAVARAAARHGMEVRPAFVYAHRHWYGAACGLLPGAPARLGFAQRCRACWARAIVAGPDRPLRCARCRAPGGAAGPLWAGPLWAGPLWDRPLVERMLADRRPLAAGTEVRAALAGWLEEAAGPPLLYDVHAAARRLGISAPRLGALLGRLRGEGFVAVRTHLAKVGIRTDADPERFLRCMQ